MNTQVIQVVHCCCIRRTILLVLGSLIISSVSIFGGVVFTNNTTISLGDVTYENQDVRVSGCTLTINGPHTFNSLLVTNSGVVTHSATTTNQEYSLLLTITGSLVISSNASISVTGCGYRPGYTLGNTTAGGTTGNAGGSYGGLGGIHPGDGTRVNAVYGDYHTPNELGSGGSSSAGGGLVRITAGTATIDGAIHANGADSGGPTGSGGGIWLSVGTLAGGGSIVANGGYSGGGGLPASGGGGRVAIYYDLNSGFDLVNKVTALGNSGGADGAVGTVYLKSSAGEEVLRIDNHGSPVGNWTPVGQATDIVIRVKALVISGTNVVVAPHHQMPVQVNQVTVRNGAVLTHQATTTNQEYSLLLIVASNVVVAAGSAIDVTGRGYQPYYTVGNTTVGGTGANSGGSYGGLGGFNSNPTYGDFRNPNELGSGGAISCGGGLVRITAATASIDGAIRADGTNGGYAGSGGGVRLDVGTLSGLGTISANGGVGTGGGIPSGGGGGRVAIYYDVNDGFDLTGKVSADGGPSYSSASVGTVYLKPTVGEGLLRIDSHGGTVSKWTPLGQASDTVLQVDQLVIRGTNVVVAAQHQMPIEVNQMTLQNGAMLTHQATTNTQEYSLLMTVAGTLTVDAGAKIDVTGRGYQAGYTLGNTTEGAAAANSGGGYGGLGGYNSNPTYGDYRDPDELGSGGAISSGGGLVRITASGATINGAIRADGANSGYAGSGGGIMLNVGTLSGSGTISANGGTGTGGGVPAGGGGGRVAIYTWSALSFPTGNVTAALGTGYRSGQTGTIHFSTTPFFSWGGTPELLHGTPQISYHALGIDPAAFDLELTAGRADSSPLVLASGNPGEPVAWDTTAAADGVYELRAVFRDPGGQTLSEISQQVLVNNSVIWHSGRITANETWAAGTVHVVDGLVTVSPGVQLTIAPGAVVKFGPGTGLIVEDGAILNSLGEDGSPIVLTALPDDTAGGDTNLDGDHSRPLSGSWRFTVRVSGQANLNEFTDVRYLKLTHTGVLATSETWKGTWVHRIVGNITVPNGITLMIEPGAVVKFDGGLGLVVQAGGQLLANGTVPQPITFTSTKDDSAGGDTNADGGKTSPSAGDWDSVFINGGQAAFDHVVMRYGAGNDSVNSGLIRADGSAAVTIANSEFHEALYHGINAVAGLTVSNCVITGCERAIKVGGVVNVVNCTLDNNTHGLVIHCGTLHAVNTIVANSIVAGIQQDCGSLGSARYCDVWSTQGVNYSGLSNQTGLNGNISVDPRFKDADEGNYRLDYRSPCIDAADGTLAPAADLMGAPRYDDPRTPNTGIATGGGAFADMGAYEFVETAVSDVDLVVASVTGPLSAVVGEQVALQWTIVNIGSGTVVGPWHDLVSLSFGTNSIAAGEVLVGAGVRLGPGQSYLASGPIRVPGTIEGTQSWQVEANRRNDIFEGLNHTNNVTHSAVPVSVTVPALNIGGVALNGIFSAVGEMHWFKLVVTTNGDVQVSLDSANDSGAVELYIGRDYVPDRDHFDIPQAEPNAADVTGFLAAATPGTYYVTVYPRSLPAGATTFTIQCRTLGFEVTEVNPSSIGTAGPVTVDILGGQLAQGMTYELIGTNGTLIAATNVTAWSSAHIRATFDLTGVEPGVFALRVTDPVSSLQTLLPNAFNVTTVPVKAPYITVQGPRRVRAGTQHKYFVDVVNPNNVNGPATYIGFNTPNYGPQVVAVSGDYASLLGTNANVYDTVLIVPPTMSPDSTVTTEIVLQMPQVPGIYPLPIPGNGVSVSPEEWDPNVRIETEVLSYTTNYAHALMHVIDPSGTNDIEWTITIEPSLTEMEPTLTNSVTGDVVEYAFGMTVPYDQIVPLGSTALTKAPSPDAIQAAIKFPWKRIWTALKGGKQAYDGAKKTQKAVSKMPKNKFEFWLVWCMAEKGCLDPNNPHDQVKTMLQDARDSWAVPLITIPLQFLPSDYGIGTLMDIGANDVWSGHFVEDARAHWPGMFCGVDTSKYCDPNTQKWNLTGLINAIMKQRSIGQCICSHKKDKDLPPEDQWPGASPAPSGSQSVGCASCSTPLAAADQPCGECLECPVFLDDKLFIEVVDSLDPNLKQEVTGYGSNAYVDGQKPLRYSILFENQPSATAPAATVVVTDVLDPTRLDLDTFALGRFVFGDHVIEPPAGAKSDTRDVDLRPGTNLVVHIEAGLDAASNVVTWRFTSIDPATGQPPEDPLQGFLPPNDAQGHGDGSVSFTVRPKAGLANSTVIQNQANVVFDYNAPIATPVVTNTIDTLAPQSSVAPLPSSATDTVFAVQWTGADGANGSGIRDYTIYVSENGGEYVPWLLNTTNTTELFTGQVGSTYAFYSVTVDSVGNGEDPPQMPDATTQVTGSSEIEPPVVQITSPTNGFATFGRTVDVTGTATDDIAVVSVVITNSRSGSTAAGLVGSNWTATNVLLRLGTNILSAVATDPSTNRTSDAVTVVRLYTNYVDTTLRTTSASLTLGALPNTDSLKVAGVFNDAEVIYQLTGTSEVVFGDYDAATPSNAVVNLKFKARASPTNTLTALSFKTKGRTFSFAASGFTVTNDDPFVVALSLGANDFGPDLIGMDVSSNAVGKFSWKYGTQLPLVDQFFLGKSKLTTSSFQLTGYINIVAKPDPRSGPVYFGIGDYDEALPPSGWAKGTGNAYTYTRPAGHGGSIEYMSLDLDRGTWSARSGNINLSFLLANPVTDIRLEISDFAASYRAKLIPKGTNFGY